MRQPLFAALSPKSTIVERIYLQLMASCSALFVCVSLHKLVQWGGAAAGRVRALRQVCALDDNCVLRGGFYADTRAVAHFILFQPAAMALFFPSMSNRRSRRESLLAQSAFDARAAVKLFYVQRRARERKVLHNLICRAARRAARANVCIMQCRLNEDCR